MRHTVTDKPFNNAELLTQGKVKKVMMGSEVMSDEGLDVLSFNKTLVIPKKMRFKYLDKMHTFNVTEVSNNKTHYLIGTHFED